MSTPPLSISCAEAMPPFLDLPMRSSEETAVAWLLARPGVQERPAESRPGNRSFEGGLFAQKAVAQWTLQFVDDQLHTAKALLVPPDAFVMREFYDLKARFDREYGPPAHGDVVVQPPYGPGSELDAIRAGQGRAAFVYTFGRDGVLEGSILLQLMPPSGIVVSYQDEPLNRLALSRLTGLDAPVSPQTAPAPASGGCFVATAAMGSADHPAVEVLRDFRDARLLPSPLGRRFVAWYYAVSPPLARAVAPRPWLRRLVAWALVRPASRLVRRFAPTT